MRCRGELPEPEEGIMDASTLVYEPVAPSRNEQRQTSKRLAGLSGKVVGFIDNAKPNFNYLVDDLAELLVSRYGVRNVIKHRKRGQVPVDVPVLEDMAAQCDLIITGSGD